MNTRTIKEICEQHVVSGPGIGSPNQFLARLYWLKAKYPADLDMEALTSTGFGHWSTVYLALALAKEVAELTERLDRIHALLKP